MTTTDNASATKLYVRSGSELVTVIERFSLDGAGKAVGAGEDMSTVVHQPSRAHEPGTTRPEVTGAARYLRDTLSKIDGFVAGLLLAGQHGEVALYSQWWTGVTTPAEPPDAWSLAPALDGFTRVDGRIYAVDFTAPDVISEVSLTGTPHAHFGVFTVIPETQEQLLGLAHYHAPASIGTPGLAAINFHRSLDGHRVINLGLWTGFAEFDHLLVQPGFEAGAKYWKGVAGFRPHFFDVAAVVTR